MRLEIVTPDGSCLSDEDVDAVVLRRQEARFENGSEVAIFPLHAATLIRIPIAPARYHRADRVVHLALGAGFVEVKHDRVLVVTSRCELIPAAQPEPSRRASAICRAWRAGSRGLLGDLVGYA